jgi:ribosomal protein L7/L12
VYHIKILKRNIMDKTLNFVDVYVVVGDYGNAGGGAVIGVFTNRDAADTAKIGRGSIDCGGNGRVDIRKGYIDGDNVYLVSGPMHLNCVLIPRKVYPKEDKVFFDVMITHVGEDPIAVLRAVKALTNFDAKRSAKIMRNSSVPIVQNVSRHEAEKIKANLEECGANIEIK